MHFYVDVFLCDYVCVPVCIYWDLLDILWSAVKKVSSTLMQIVIRSGSMKRKVALTGRVMGLFRTDWKPVHTKEKSQFGASTSVCPTQNTENTFARTGPCASLTGKQNKDNSSLKFIDKRSRQELNSIRGQLICTKDWACLTSFWPLPDYWTNI